MHRAIRGIGVLAGSHLLLLGLALLLVIGQLSGDGDRTPVDQQVGDAAGRVMLALAEPAASVDAALGTGRRYGDAVSWALVPVNSLLWGATLYLGLRVVRRRT
jgi:hypothetical protein